MSLLKKREDYKAALFVIAAALFFIWFGLSSCSPVNASSVVEAREIPSPSPDLICFAFYQQPHSVEAFAANCVKR